jgi:hypothetical protein
MNADDKSEASAFKGRLPDNYLCGTTKTHFSSELHSIPGSKHLTRNLTVDI